MCKWIHRKKILEAQFLGQKIWPFPSGWTISNQPLQRRYKFHCCFQINVWEGLTKLFSCFGCFHLTDKIKLHCSVFVISLIMSEVEDPFMSLTATKGFTHSHCKVLLFGLFCPKFNLLSFNFHFLGVFCHLFIFSLSKRLGWVCQLSLGTSWCCLLFSNTDCCQKGRKSTLIFPSCLRGGLDHFV